MNLKDLKKPLSIDDIDFRVQSINNGGYATILAYKDARVDMNRLDDVVGAESWQRNHKEVKGVVYCGIGINIGSLEIPEWVWKWDAGAESYTEKEKGQASDSFKRAGFNWGIGRELYDYPIIQIKFNSAELTEKNGKKVLSWDCKFRDWKWFSEWDDKGLKYLGCRDTYNKVRYKWLRQDE